MSETYFKNFKTIQYGEANTAAIDITQRVITLKNIKKNPYIFYPLDITDGARADTISYINWEDPFASWLLYLNNDIVDPYYDWYLTENQFNEFLTKKYGSLQAASQKIAFWRNNWADKPSIDVATYNAEIAGNPARIKYWQPQINPTGKIISYSRAPIDWVVNTNKLVKYTYTGSASFIVNELVNINGTGTAQVLNSNSSTLVVTQTVNDINTSNGYIYGTESGANVTVTSISYQSNNISDDEIYYWEPVYYLNMENEKNEGNRTIRVIQNSYVPGFINNVKQALSQ